MGKVFLQLLSVWQGLLALEGEALLINNYDDDSVDDDHDDDNGDNGDEYECMARIVVSCHQ